jgi:FKBP-type peptidyl-prolyl cis-trans isomerase 2
MINTVQTGQTVRIHYKGTLEDGSEFDNSRIRGEMMEVEVGSGNLIAGFDAALLGMHVGETKNITLAPKDAYGYTNPKAVLETPKGSFPDGFEFRVGEVITGANETGQPLIATILEEKESTVVLDMNHPMAGKKLNFEIELIGIQE